MDESRDQSLPPVTSPNFRKFVAMYCLLPATRLAGRRIITRARPRRSILSVIPPSNPALSNLRSSSFHTSSFRQNDQPKSPYQTFIDTLQEEIRKNRKFQEDLLQLKGDVDKLQDSEALKRARDVYERARVEFLFASPSSLSHPPSALLIDFE
jgi:hypothetical protein